MLPLDLQEAATARYADQVASLAEQATERLLVIWDSLTDWTEADAALFAELATPITTATTRAATATATAYATQVATSTPSAVSPLMVADAIARLYDPFDRLASQLASGTSIEEAVASGRSVVKDLGRDTAYRSARQAMGEITGPGTTWVRRITGKSCPWCMRLSSAEFSSAAKATFGHPNCDCLPVPAQLGLGHNESTRTAAGFDAEQEKLYDQGQAKRRLRKSATTATANERKARLDAQSEPDPARAQRLLDRADHWHARSLRANQRLDLMATAA